MINGKTNGSMSQEISTLGLDTETVSLYLLCCGLVDIGDTLTDRSLREVWNGSDDAMKNAIADLLDQGILRKAISVEEDQSAYYLMPQERWR